jgi:DNA mismatch repair protein MutS2
MLLGVPGQSCALLVAERLGLPGALITQAADAIARPEPEEEVIRRMEKARRAVEAERRRVQKLRRRCAEMKTQLARKLEEAERARGVADREAEQEIERKVREVREAIRALLPRLSSVPQGLRPHVEELETLAERVLQTTPLGDRREAFARGLKENADVYVPRLGRVCRVLRVNKSKRKLTVRTEGMEAEVGFDDISWAPPPTC